MTLSADAMFEKARRVSVPIIAISTPDPFATIRRLGALVGTDVPQVQWDVCRGFSAVNKAGQQFVQNVQTPDFIVREPDQALIRALQLPADAVLYMHGTDAWWTANGIELAAYRQGVLNCRDLFSQSGRTLVLLASTINVPNALDGDILTIDEPLPTPEELTDVVLKALANAEASMPDFPVLDPEGVIRAVDALRGLAHFPADQAASLSLSREGMDIESLWNRKRERIQQTPGLSVYDGPETFTNICGCENVKADISRTFNGPEAPRVIVFVDEIEKAMAGSTGGDLSGVSQEMHGTLLSWMQDTRTTGYIFLGPPGTAKSAIAKAAGKQSGVPTICFDLSAMKGSLVGESNANLRKALKVVDAVGGGRAMVIATCNGIAALSPELRRRFVDGIFFFDLPTAEERAAIWSVYGDRYGVEVASVALNDEGWTGAEIENACRRAYRQQIPVAEAAKNVIPVSVSARERIDALRREADGKYLAAAHPGAYKYPGNSDVQASAQSEPVATDGRRKLALG